MRYSIRRHGPPLSYQTSPIRINFPPISHTSTTALRPVQICVFFVIYIHQLTNTAIRSFLSSNIFLSVSSSVAG